MPAPRFAPRRVADRALPPRVGTGHRRERLHPGAGRRLPGSRHTLRMRLPLHQWQHAVYRLFRSDQQSTRLRREGPLLHRLHSGQHRKPRNRPGPGWHCRSRGPLLPLQPSLLISGTEASGANPMTSATAPDTKRRITIDPITRLEGHGKIEIFLDDKGGVERAFFQVPELRGFEKFAQGRLAEDMPQITSRICGVCPTAHHMASTKALDALYHVTPPPAARKIRELVYSTFMVEDHALHFYFLGGPDFVVGPTAPAAERNILGVIAKVGAETATRVIAMRRRLRELVALAAGKPIHPVFGVPGGVSKTLSTETAAQFRTVDRKSTRLNSSHLGI